MATRKTKSKTQAKTRGRKKSVKLSNLPVTAKAVKGGNIITTANATSPKFSNVGSLPEGVTTGTFEGWIE